MAYTIYRKDTPRIRGVIFDMDGLVLDTEVLYTRFWMESCRSYGFPMTRQQALAMRSIGAKEGQANFLRWFGPEADYHRIRARRVELMDAFIEAEGFCIKPGIPELLAFLKSRGIPAAIATSSPLERAQQHLQRVGLMAYFDHICSGRQVSNPKPAPDIYRHAASLLGLAPENCLALEDSPTGIRSAHSAGCIPVMIPDQDQPTPEITALLFAKCDSAKEIISIILQ